jgi:hypothetical protein
MHNAPSVDKETMGSTYISGNGQLTIDYNKMADAFSSSLSRNPRVLLQIDKNGFHIHQLQQNHTKTYLDNRYNGNA